MCQNVCRNQQSLHACQACLSMCYDHTNLKVAVPVQLEWGALSVTSHKPNPPHYALCLMPLRSVVPVPVTTCGVDWLKCMCIRWKWHSGARRGQCLLFSKKKRGSTNTNGEKLWVSCIYSPASSKGWCQVPIHEEPTAHLANSLKVHVMVARNVRICQGDDRKPLSSHNNLVLLTHGVCDTKPKHRHFTTDTHTPQNVYYHPQKTSFFFTSTHCKTLL